MKLNCQLIDNHLADAFLVGQHNSQLLQSSSWINFQNTTGKRSWCLGVLNHDQVVAVANVLEQNIFAGLTYLYCPRGPIVDSSLSISEKNEVIKLLLGKVREITIATINKDEVYAKFEPLFSCPALFEVCVKGQNIQPANTLLINLKKSTEQLINDFHPKTRYNIKIAEKNEVYVSTLANNEFDKVWPLFNQTSERSHFRLHDKNYYQLMLKHLPTAKLWIASYNDQIVATAITAHFGDTITYLHGASDHNLRSLMAPYLLHWQIINWSIKNNFFWYDMHGISPANQPHHSLANVTRFKLGFGGEQVNYPGAFDLIFSSGLYHGYNLAKKIIKMLKKLTN